MKKINILYIQHTSEVGGSLVSLYNILSGIQAMREDFNLTVLCKSQEMAEWYQQRKIAAIYFPHIGFLGHCSGCTYQLTNPLNLYSLIKQLVLLPWFVVSQYLFLRKHNFHLVHLNSSVLLSSALATKIAGSKLVWHIREVISEGNLGIRKKLLINCIKKLADKIVAISPYEAFKIGEDPLGKIQVIYNFLDFKNFALNLYNREEERKKYSIPLEAKVILSLGGLSPIKGALELIGALPRGKTDIHLVFAGVNELSKDKDKDKDVTSVIKRFFLKFLKSDQDSYPKKVQEAIQDKIGEGNIHLLRPTHEVARLISMADLIYFGGTIPHFPRPIFEAWALKKPIVAFNIDGVKQNVIHQGDGYLVNNITSDDLGKAVVYLFANRDLMRQMAEAGYLKARDKFDLNKNLKEIISLYEELTAKLSDEDPNQD